MSILIQKTLKQFKFAGLMLASPSLKKPAANKVLGAVSDVALKLMPNKAGLFAMQFERSTKNPNGTKYLENDKLIYH